MDHVVYEGLFLIASRNTIVNYNPKRAFTHYHYQTDIYEMPIAMNAPDASTSLA